MLSAFLLVLAVVQISETPDGEIFASPTSTAAVREDAFDGSASELDIPAPWVGEARMSIDGWLDEAEWERAALLRGFTQYEPVEGVQASQRTEVLVLVTDDALHFGVRAFDEGASAIRATLAERDGFGRSDDFVRFTLDTFNDQRRAYVFMVNPLGVQQDGIWLEGGGGRFGDPIDYNPDFVWQSAGTLHEAGYTLELKVPFKSLRFPELPVQDWGLQVVRRIQRNGFEESWAPVSSERANRLAQSGRIKGLRDLDPGLFLEVNPVVTASRVGAVDDTGGFAHDPATGDFGLNLTYGLTSNLTLDGTYNPDFSQVESDAGQIAVNERFALFFPEKRAFFLEGTDVFAMPRRLVYTRSIVNPVGAAKVSGKVGSFNLAYLGAVDDLTSSGQNPVVNLARVKRDVGATSSVGLAYADRSVSSRDYNRVAGADGRFVLRGRYTLNLLAASSATGQQDRSVDWGSLLYAQLERSGRKLTFNASFEDVDEDFRARSGFIRRVGDTQMEGRVGYNWRGQRGAFLQTWGPWIEAQGVWDRSDFWAGRRWQESEVQLGLRASLRNNITSFVTYSRSSFAFGSDDYAGLVTRDGRGQAAPFAPSHEYFAGLNEVRFRMWASGWERVRGSVAASWGETPLFERSLGVPVDLATSWDGEVEVTLYPTRALTTELGLRHVTLFRERDGSRYSSATIPRVRAQYQFSRALFVRGIGEYSSQERGDLLDPETGRALESCDEDGCEALTGSDAHDFRLEGLLGYEPTPGTVLYVGYSRSMRDSAFLRFRDVRTEEDGLFVKLSYRFRM